MIDQGVDDDMAFQPAIVRLGHHAIELGKAADEIRKPALTEAVQTALVAVGREIAWNATGSDQQSS